MKWIAIFLFALLTITSVGYAENMIEVPESELKEYLDRIEADRETIKTLREENYQLKVDKMKIEAELALWKQRDENQLGMYLGGGAGYPLLSLEGVAMYKFRTWGLYVSGGYYGKGPALNVGIMVKTK